MTDRTLKDQTAIVGVGATPYYKRGRSLPQTPMELAGKAVLSALQDAGLTADDLDGFALYSMGFDTSLFAQWLGVPEVRFTALLTGGGGGSAGSVGLASAAIVSGMAECVVSVMTLQQAASRLQGSGSLGEAYNDYNLAYALTQTQGFSRSIALIVPCRALAEPLQRVR